MPTKHRCKGSCGKSRKHDCDNQLLRPTGGRGGGGGLSHAKYLDMSGLGGYVMVGKQIKGLNNMLLDWVEFQGNHKSDQQIYFFISAWVLE